MMEKGTLYCLTTFLGMPLAEERYDPVPVFAPMGSPRKPGWQWYVMQGGRHRVGEGRKVAYNAYDQKEGERDIGKFEYA